MIESSSPTSQGDFITVERNGRKRSANAGVGRPARSNSRPRKVSNLVVGKKVVDGLISWRGADLTTELYVGNVSVNVSLEEAKTAISELGVDVVELERVGKHNHFQSFRLRIRKADMDKIRDPEFWPDGIIVRRFFRGKRNNNNNNNNNNKNPRVNDGVAITSL